MSTRQYLYLLVFAALVCCTGKEEKAAVPEIKREMDTTFVTETGCRVDEFRIWSPSMERHIKAVVVMPPAYETDKEKKFPVLHTLHGHAAPYNTWANMRRLQNKIKKQPFVYTCFDGDISSGYIDAYYPIKTSRDKSDSTEQKSLFKTFFFKEFVPGIDSWYRINPEKRGITGFSMGGRGAFGYMLSAPDMFCSVSGLSSAFVGMPSDTSRTLLRYEKYLGSHKEHPERFAAIDQYVQLKKLVDAGTQLPPVFQECGKDDRIIERPRKMAAFAKELGLTNYVYKETEGAHNWKYWHPASERIADFHWEYFKD